MRASMLAIVGPTASGKTRRAVEVASAIGGEVISADSRQVYRGMDIGTGKDLEEYGSVPFHLIDICPAGHKYNLFEYVRDFDDALSLVREHGNFPIVCGGTGLYIETVLNGIHLPEVPENPDLRSRLQGATLAELTDMLASMKTLHNRTDIDTVKRAVRAIEIEVFYRDHPEKAKLAAPVPVAGAVIVGIGIDRDTRRARISARLEARIKSGMIAEVERLLAGGVPPGDLIYYGLEYKFVTQHVIGQLSRDDMLRSLEIAIHQFAKRQMTWFRGMERRGFHIRWFPWDMPSDEFIDSVKQLIQ